MSEESSFDKKCRFCGEQEFRWGQNKNGSWKLIDSAGKQHNCDNPLKRNYAKARRMHDTMKNYMEETVRAIHVDNMTKKAQESKKRLKEGVADYVADGEGELIF